MPDFGAAERFILSLFQIGSKLKFEGEIFTVSIAGKPTCFLGEPKTDVYVLLTNEHKQKEIKISYKKDNADFLENKTSAQRAELLFGPQWRQIIMTSTFAIRDRFLNRPLIYKNAGMRTEAGSITLGWKFELLNKPGGELSGLMNLTPRQVYDVYAGFNLPIEKRNAGVNGTIIPESGVANYILMGNAFSSAQQVLDNMVSIEDYIRAKPYIYFACKALNYRTFPNKYDGDRPLSVQVNWFVNGQNKLDCNLCFDRPLEFNGNLAASQLQMALGSLGIRNTNDINESNNCCTKIN